MEDVDVSDLWDCSQEEWDDWRWQLANSITTAGELKEKFNISDQQVKQIEEAREIFPMSITPYYASLIDFDQELCPIRLQAVPQKAELEQSKYEMDDPLHEEEDSPVSGLTHRYPDRVLLMVTNKCSMFCRHCTRKRKVGDGESRVDLEQIKKGIEYIKDNPQIRDVLLSGGDPLLLDLDILEEVISELKDIPHVEIVRLGSRVPVVLPQRINDELVNRLKKYSPLWINTHFNHKKEVTPRAKEALNKLADNGFPLGNQTVLLRNVNDCPLVMKELMHELVKNRIRPYYLYQCDLSRGIEHFRTSVSTGIEIIESLIGHTSGFAVPRYVVDAPGGGGKIPITPNYLVSNSRRKTVLRNYEGDIVVYTEPEIKEDNCPEECNVCTENKEKAANGEAVEPSGVQKLLSEDTKEFSL
ncbi:lysine 2,3-aminomutase [Selenihalanaerobacter shriftii]|uniref:L-lysine 2,3-aminomutase n=1 Tax=Selenihalanaerobacter shriftii TaxID=142842 RepID=A0A1T4K8Z3_9FIRM|nr:lysine 2,3-aminomutase [Selenihalanaerobacter shriftii]SJZ38879.1 L-lysine 2,3-aminomutase [Selenihalanaerobacter shriftii]